MPIKIPDKLPAYEALMAEGVRVMTEAEAIRQDIRPLQIGLLNLMPNKIKTELQITRLLAATPLAGRPEAGPARHPHAEDTRPKTT